MAYDTHWDTCVFTAKDILNVSHFKSSSCERYKPSDFLISNVKLMTPHSDVNKE